MTGAGAMLNVVKPTKSSSVCVVGAGAVGLAAIMAVNLVKEEDRPRRVIAVDVVNGRLDLARKYGATHTVNSSEVKDLKAELLRLTDGEGVTGSIDCTGRPDVVSTLIDATAKRGIIVSVGVGKVFTPSPFFVPSTLTHPSARRRRLSQHIQHRQQWTCLHGLLHG